MDPPPSGDQELPYRLTPLDLLPEITPLPLGLGRTPSGVAVAAAAHRCQMVPPGVSSSLMPRAVSSSRICVGPGEVARGAGLVALAHERVDRRVGILGRGGVVGEVEAEDRAQLPDRGHQPPRPGVVALVDETVRVPRRLEEHRQRVRGVEVVVHRRPEPVKRLGIGGRARGGPRGVGAPEQRVQALDRLGRGGQLGGTEIGGAPVVRLEHRQPDGAGVEVGQRLVDGGEVAERLRHLVAADRHHARVDPVPGEVVAGGSRLRPLVLVVREREVLATAVEVEALAEQVERHRRALDVPSRPAAAPGRVPRRLAGLGRLPEREVHRAALRLVDVDPCAGRLPELRRAYGAAARRSPRSVSTSKYTP